jgi:hypothetical protein
MGKVRADDPSIPGTRESETEISGSAAKIEDKCIRLVENTPQAPGGACAPKPVQLQ